MVNNKLFNILVLGGAMLATPAAMAEARGSTEAIEQSVFCTDMDACDKVHSCSVEGDLQTEYIVKEGLVCCWNTSCSDLANGE